MTTLLTTKTFLVFATVLTFMVCLTVLVCLDKATFSQVIPYMTLFAGFGAGVPVSAAETAPK